MWLKHELLCASVLAFAGSASARSVTYDPAQLPSVEGRVVQYTLTPRGDVDGLILDSGMQVQVSPRASLDLVFAVRPGDQVTAHGLKAQAIAMMRAVSVTNDATHATVVTERLGRGHDRDDQMEARGKVKMQLHDTDGDLDGVLLDDGTTVDLPSAEAASLGAQVAVGATIYVRGPGVADALGRAVAARFLGPDKQAAVELHDASEDDDGGHRGRGHRDRGD